MGYFRVQWVFNFELLGFPGGGPRDHMNMRILQDMIPGFSPVLECRILILIWSLWVVVYRGVRSVDMSS